MMNVRDPALNKRAVALSVAGVVAAGVCFAALSPRWLEHSAPVAARVDGTAAATASDSAPASNAAAVAAADPAAASDLVTAPASVSASASASASVSASASCGPTHTCASAAAIPPSAASPARGRAARRAPAVTASAADHAADWAELSAAQRLVLAPFAREWDSFGRDRRRKWIGIADAYPRMSAPAQERLRERLVNWARMAPEQRRIARENFQVSQRLSPAERENAWRAYQALPEAQKRKLAARAAATPRSVVSAPPGAPASRPGLTAARAPLLARTAPAVPASVSSAATARTSSRAGARLAAPAHPAPPTPNGPAAALADPANPATAGAQASASTTVAPRPAVLIDPASERP